MQRRSTLTIQSWRDSLNKLIFRARESADLKDLDGLMQYVKQIDEIMGKYAVFASFNVKNELYKKVTLLLTELNLQKEAPNIFCEFFYLNFLKLYQAKLNTPADFHLEPFLQHYLQQNQDAWRNFLVAKQHQILAQNNTAEERQRYNQIINITYPKMQVAVSPQKKSNLVQNSLFAFAGITVLTGMGMYINKGLKK